MSTNIISHVPATQTMSSREIAQLTGKRHGNVIRDIEVMLAQIDDSVLSHEENQSVRIEKDERGYTSCIYLDKDHTLTLLTGYDAKARLRVIRRWQELEAAAATPARLPTHLETAKMLVASLEREAALSAELAAAKPAIAFHAEVAVHPDIELLVREVAKIIGVGDRYLSTWMYHHGWLTKTGHGREPTADQVRRGMLRQRIDLVNGMRYTVPVVTGKGLAYLRAAMRNGELIW